MTAQLWMKSSANFALPGFHRLEGDSRWTAPHMKAIFWPDMQICWQLNLYLLFCRRSGKAVSTVNTYASELSVFVRFSFEENLKFEDVDDDSLVDFSNWLVSRKRSSGNHINRMIIRVIGFLEWYQTLLCRKRLVGTLGQGAQVTISLRSRKSRRGGLRTKVEHQSMVPRSSARTVVPISRNLIDNLISACGWVGKSYFKRSRDRCIIILLADSGMRREELTWVRCDDINDAICNNGRLLVRTSKKKGNPHREVPVQIETLNALKGFIDVAREIQMKRARRKLNGHNDHGWLFCTRTGAKMSPNTISQIFSDLRVGANINERASAHMFRHRYITLQVLKRLRVISRNGSIGVEALTTVLSKVASISGHSSLDSMWRYVDWAYEELEMEASEELEVDDEVLDVVSGLLDEASKGTDAALISALTVVRNKLSEMGRRDFFLPSVVAHSLRGKKLR